MPCTATIITSSRHGPECLDSAWLCASPWGTWAWARSPNQRPTTDQSVFPGRTDWTFQEYAHNLHLADGRVPPAQLALPHPRRRCLRREEGWFTILAGQWRPLAWPGAKIRAPGEAKHDAKEKARHRQAAADNELVLTARKHRPSPPCCQKDSCFWHRTRPASKGKWWWGGEDGCLGVERDCLGGERGCGRRWMGRNKGDEQPPRPPVRFCHLWRWMPARARARSTTTTTPSIPNPLVPLFSRHAPAPIRILVHVPVYQKRVH